MHTAAATMPVSRYPAMVDVGTMDRIDMAAHIGRLEVALADTKRALEISERKRRELGGGDITPDQRAWLLSLADDPDRVEDWLNTIIDEGVTLIVPTEKCDGCDGGHSVDQMSGLPYVRRLCPSCSSVEAHADDAFDAER